MLYFARGVRKQPDTSTSAASGASSLVAPPAAPVVPALLAEELHTLPLQCLKSLSDLPQECSEDLLKETLATVFAKLSNYYSRAEAGLRQQNIYHESSKAILVEFFNRQGHTLTLDIQTHYQWINTYHEMFVKYKELKDSLAEVSFDTELPVLDKIYIELLKMHNDSNLFIQSIVSNAFPGIAAVSLEESFILNEQKIIEIARDRMQRYLSASTQLIIQKSDIMFDADDLRVFFTVQVKALRDYFQAKYDCIKPTLAELETIRCQELIDEIEELKTHAQLFEASIQAFTPLLFRNGAPLDALYKRVALILPLCELVELVPEKVQSLKERSLIFPDPQVVELAQALEQCEIATHLSPVTHTPYYEKSKRVVSTSSSSSSSLSSSSSSSSSSSTPTHLSWGDKLEKHRGVIDEIFSTKKVYPKELLKLVQALGGTLKPQKKGIGLSLPKSVQAAFPSSSSTSFESNFHTPHKGRREGPLSPDLVDKFKHLLTACELTPTKLWPGAKAKKVFSRS